jgi:DNA-binding transcriptional ArsR family regulator
MAGNQQITVFQVLADPTRLAIFEHLSRGESTVGALAEKFPISQLVDHRREGRNIFYQARPEGLAPLNDWLNHYRVFWPERLAKLRKVVGEQTAGKGEKR